MLVQKQDWGTKIGDFFHIPTMVALVIIASFFSVLIFWELFEAIRSFFTNEFNGHQILENIFLSMLYIEIVAAIKIYFQQNYHFPLRFFIYMGITDLVRFIMIHESSAQDVLFLSLGVVVLVIALSLLDFKNRYIEKRHKKDEAQDFPL